MDQDQQQSWVCVLCGVEGNEKKFCEGCNASCFRDTDSDEYFFAGVPLTELIEECDAEEKKRYRDHFNTTMKQYYWMKYCLAQDKKRTRNF